MSNQLQKNSVRLGLASLALIGAIAFAGSPAQAQTGGGGGGGTEMQDAIDDITSFNSAMTGIVSSLTTVAIFPAGISASIRAFRHIVLSNV